VSVDVLTVCCDVLCAVVVFSAWNVYPCAVHTSPEYLTI